MHDIRKLLLVHPVPKISLTQYMCKKKPNSCNIKSDLVQGICFNKI